MHTMFAHLTLIFVGETLHLSWIVPILIRNVLACLAICGFWDWFLYLSPWQKKLAKFKVTHTLQQNALTTEF